MFKILVVEDDPGAGRLMVDTLIDGGYTPILAKDGMQALNIIASQHVDLVILDLMLPKLDGFNVLQQIRKTNMVIPIMILSAKQMITDRRQGLRYGADDYMVKPADEEELLLRIAALLRRYQAIYNHQLRVNQTTLNYDDLSVTCAGCSIILPRKEFMLLFKLLSNPSKTFTRRQLMDEIWDMDSESEEHTINVHINRLREKFKSNPDFQIVTVRGLGYKAEVKSCKS